MTLSQRTRFCEKPKTGRVPAARSQLSCQALGIRHCMVQWTPVFKKEISVLPSKGRSADFNSLVPKPGAPTSSTAGPSVSSQVMLRRSSEAHHDTCNNPREEENAPYFPALVASSWNINA